MTKRHVRVLTRTERRGLAFLTFTHIADDIYSGAVPALLPFLALERHYSYTELTGIILAATLLASVVQSGFGALTDKYRNLGWLIAVGLLVAGLGIGLSGLGDNYLFTCLAVAASGIGVAAYHPEATRAARGLAGNSTHAMSWFTVGGNAGIALGPVIVTPVLLETRLRGTPLLALPAVIIAAVLSVRRPWRAPEVTAREDGRRRAANGRADDWRGFGRLTAVVVLRSVAYFGVASLVALYAIRHFHQPTAVGAAALATFIGSGVIGTLGGGWLADHWQRVGVLRLGYGLSALALVLLVFAPDIAVLFIAAFILGIVLYAPFAVQVTLGQDYLPNRIGVASGVTLGLAVSAGGLATPLFGLLADSNGLMIALGVIAVIPATACALAFLVRDPHPHEAPDRHATADRQSADCTPGRGTGQIRSSEDVGPQLGGKPPKFRG